MNKTVYTPSEFRKEAREQYTIIISGFGNVLAGQYPTFESALLDLMNRGKDIERYEEVKKAVGLAIAYAVQSTLCHHLSVEYGEVPTALPHDSVDGSLKELYDGNDYVICAQAREGYTHFAIGAGIGFSMSQWMNDHVIQTCIQQITRGVERQYAQRFKQVA